MPNPAMMKFFEFAHLPEKLQAVSKPIGEVAKQMEESLTDSAEKTTGLRKLLEAKDCFVRAALLVLFAVGVLGYAGSASAETPWHLQPMDTWHEGECYRSPNTLSVAALERLAEDHISQRPAVTVRAAPGERTKFVDDFVPASKPPLKPGDFFRHTACHWEHDVFRVSRVERGPKDWMVYHTGSNRPTESYYCKPISVQDIDVEDFAAIIASEQLAAAQAGTPKDDPIGDATKAQKARANDSTAPRIAEYRPVTVDDGIEFGDVAKWKAAYDREQARKAKKAGKKSK